MLMFDGPESTGMTLITHFAADTKYFGDGPQSWMLNLRVDDLDSLLEQLTASGVRVDPDRQDSDFGKFGWIWDPEGNRIELWQPPSEG
jgi:predicted enzyme related to lactoylglutathione lyase